jgi:hypothetical protein
MRALIIAALVGLLVLDGNASLVATAQGTPSITITKPSAAGDLLAEGDDFATTVIGNAWDFASGSEIPPDVDSYLSFTASTVGYTNGIWHGVASTHDPVLWLLGNGYGQVDPCCLAHVHMKSNDGYISPLNADKYHVAVIRMKLTNAAPGAFGQFYWYRSDSPFDETEASVSFLTTNGWRTYVIDLKTHGSLIGSWSGIIRGFRFDPTNTAGATVEIDWVRLLADTTPASTHTIQWQTANAPAGAIVDLSCLEGGLVTCNIAQGVQASAGSFNWSSHLVHPGSHTVQARMGTDYAALRVNDPWDMTSANDVDALHDLQGSFNQPLSGGLTGFKGTVTGPDSQVTLNTPIPIDAATFKRLTISMRLSTLEGGVGNVGVVWFANGAWRSSSLQSASTGMSQLTWDLSTFPDWNGQVTGLRFDPAGGLTPSGTPIQVEVGPVTLTTSGADVRVFSSNSPGPLVINTAPQIQITAPSMTSGPDFATTVLGDPWDMSNQQDIIRVVNTTGSFANGILSGVSPPPPTGGDPQVEINLRNQRIDTQRFRYATLRYGLDDSMDTPERRARPWREKFGEGWVGRFIWWGPGGPGVDSCTTAPTVTEPIPYTYSVDLGTIPIEPDCGPQGRPWLSSNVTTLRFDQHEIGPATGWYIDYFLLTAVQEVTTLLNIFWTAQEPNAGQTAQVDLFYSPVNTGAGLTPIATVPAARGMYAWSMAGLPRGKYYIIARIRDGLNTNQRISEAPFNAIAPPTSPAACTPRPKVTVNTAPSGDGRLRVTVTTSGAGNGMQSIRFNATNKALLDVPGGPTGSTGNFVHQLTGSPTSFSFFMRRQEAGQAATSNFTVVDACGDWPTLAGGGPTAPF